ncbi:MAG: RagB/SusD family nutrient uptake outer membrane protein [Bacteroidales bacterium]
MKTLKRLIGSVFILLCFIGCDPLSKENLGAIQTEDVWGNPAVAEAYVNDIYGSLMPADWNTPRWDDQSNDVNGGDGLSAYLKGSMTVDTYNGYDNYAVIRRINIFLAGIDAATFADANKQSLKGQMLFWRAWVYFAAVKAYGGVELVLEPGDPANIEATFIPRSSTSACMTQILKDLDAAIELLENKSVIGRVDKCVGMSFKGRVLLYWASPQFNRTNDVARWTAAYEANKAALAFLDAQGKGLYSKYRELWLDEMNKEVIMVRRYQYPSFANGYSQACMRPLLYARGCVGSNYPTLELVDAYAMKDGSKWDPATMDYKTFFQNREGRFYASIAYNGSAPFISPMFGNENMWTYFYDLDNNAATGINGKEASAANKSVFGTGAENLFSHSGFYPAKMMDQTITRTTVEDGQVDWIEIRYAEVLMNMAEAANETGKTAEALDVLYKIRQRAGIDGPTYGVTASSAADIRKAIQDERFVEFAFEGKRFWDLRRWRIFTSTMNALKDSYLHGLRMEWNGPTANAPDRLTDINTVLDQFSASVINGYAKVVVLDEDKYSFFGIPKAILERNSKIEQNNTWGGAFDPLK